MGWSPSFWYVVLTLVLGSGAGLLAYVFAKIIDTPAVPKDRAAARDELELHVRRVINANMHLMECCRDLADLCKRLPPEYAVIGEQGLRFAKLMEEATFAEGERERIFARPMFGAAPVEGSAPDAPAAAEDWAPISEHQRRRWIGGQLIEEGRDSP
jgi:hypothetical protein